MNAEQFQVDFPEVQAAIYRVALSLDSLDFIGNKLFVRFC
jgi:hypothetical protein